MRYKTCQAGAIAPAPLLATFWNVLARDHQVFAKISDRRAAILPHDDRILDAHPEEDVHQGRLSGTVFADEPKDPGPDFQSTLW